ncbi:MAG: HAD-IB family phosphatase, partial [Candidatus Paceibacterota bacterium]
SVQTNWLNRAGDYDDYIMKVIEAFMRHLKGVSYRDFDRISKEVIARHQNRTYRYTRDLIKQLKKKGYFLLAISQSPKTILDKFCSKLGFDKVYGRIYELGPTDCFNGKVVDEHLIQNKATILRRAVERNGLTLKDSVGVGDTDGDIPFLELVAKPICFNPNSGLFKQAKRLGWKSVIERNDVVYEVQ